MPDRSVNVLLVGPDVDEWVDAVDVPDGVSLTATASSTAARAYLSGTAFDAVLLQAGAAGASGLRALRDVLGLATPIETIGSAEQLGEWVGARAGGGAPFDERAVLLDLRRELGRVAHSLNNPLSVIMGNAQLGIELSTALETDEDVVAALVSIYEASGELSQLFGEVAALRDRIDRLLAPGGDAGAD